MTNLIGLLERDKSGECLASRFLSLWALSQIDAPEESRKPGKYSTCGNRLHI